MQCSNGTGFVRLKSGSYATAVVQFWLPVMHRGLNRKHPAKSLSPESPSHGCPFVASTNYSSHLNTAVTHLTQAINSCATAAAAQIR